MSSTTLPPAAPARRLGGRLVGIAWDGMPFYAARLIRHAVKTVPFPIQVVGIGEPPQPKAFIEAALSQQIFWNSPRDPRLGWRSLGGEIPSVCITSGWRDAACIRLAEEVRREGGTACLMADNPWRGTIRQRCGRFLFRARFRDLFSYAWVPGKAAVPFMLRLGFPRDRIFTGLYGADGSVFAPGPPAADRPKRFVFVGRLVHQKAVDVLAAAFAASDAACDGWELVIIGEGALRGHCQARGIRCVGSQNPLEVAAWLRSSRCLVLPSRVENWGVVVHEACLAGCAIIVSQAVGAAADLATLANSIEVRPGSVGSLRMAIDEMSRWPHERWNAAGTTSLGFAAQFGPVPWQQGLQSFYDATAAAQSNAANNNAATSSLRSAEVSRDAVR